MLQGDETFLFNFWRLITENIPEWHDLEKRVIAKQVLREEYVTTLGVTLLSFSRIGMWLYQNRDKSMENYLINLKKIDWSRTNPAWINRIIRDDGKIMNNENAIILAGNYIKTCLGMPLTKEEEKREEGIR